MYEREIRSTLSKLERVCGLIPEDSTHKQKTKDDLVRLTDQFRDLIFNESQPDEAQVEKDMKKLLTVAKSKFYMLRVNYPQAFEHVTK